MTSARSIPPWLSAVVARLELDARAFVTSQEIADLAVAASPDMKNPLIVVRKLSERGWLLPTEIRGVWEFVPGAAGGVYSGKQSFRTLRAALTAAPDLDIRVGLESAMWLHSVADRIPAEETYTARPETPIPAGLRRSGHVVTFDSATAPDEIDGIPVENPATILAHAATRPARLHDLRGFRAHLPELADLADQADLERESERLSEASRRRLAYLLSETLPNFAAALVPQPGGLVWFGPRRKQGRWSAHWNVMDTTRTKETAGDRA